MGDLSPVFAIVSGESGVGKSTDQLLAFPTAWFLCLKGADKPGYQFGLAPITVEVSLLSHAVEVLQHTATLPPEQKPPAIIIDDLTLLAENSYDFLKPQYPKNQVFAFWERMKQELRAVRTTAREVGVHVFASAHLAKPDTDQAGNFHKGGPVMPGRKMRSAIPHIADEVYLAELEPGHEPWPGVYWCEPHPEWHMKSRLGLMRGRAPMNLRELMRQRGYTLPRMAGAEWQEAVAQQVADTILKGEPWKDVWNRAEVQLMSKGLHPGLVYWALRDGVDRATLAKRQVLLGRFQPSTEKKES